MIRAVFFDVGETLVNEARMWAEFAARVGVEAHVVWAAVGAVVERGDEHWLAWERIGVERPDSAGFDGADLYPDAEPCLRRLRDGGYFVGLAGNVGRPLEPFVEQFALDVDFAAASHTLGAEKPSPEFFARLLEEVDAEPGEVAYVGDRVDNDVVPAAAAGMVAVHIRRGPWGYLQRGAEQAALRIRSLDELPAAFAGV
jgi:HAD superfamily hydrolase (TIGR01549 family)